MDGSGSSALEAFSSLIVQRGMFVLRYVSAADSQGWPLAEIHVPADFEKRVRLISAPGAPVGQLEGPGSCMVVVAEAPTTLTIGLRSGRPGGSLEAVIRLERLDLQKAAESESKAPEASQAPVISGSGVASVSNTIPDLELVAHVARRGDVVVAPGAWAAGPEAPAAIEGLVVRLKSEAGVSLQIQALLGLRNQTWTEWANAGEFVGTRGRALPISGLRFRLDGPRSAGLVLAVDALFLGSQISTQRGRSVEVASAFGADPLVGLRVLVQRDQDLRGGDSSGVEATASNSKIKIFRAPQRR